MYQAAGIDLRARLRGKSCDAGFVSRVLLFLHQRQCFEALKAVPVPSSSYSAPGVLEGTPTMWFLYKVGTFVYQSPHDP